MEENSSEFGAFLAGFVIGGLVGAAAALILAPQSGSETRSKIVDKSHDFREAGGRRANQARESASTYVQDFGELASQKSQQVQEQARIVLDTGRKPTTNIDKNGNPEGDEIPSAGTNNPALE